MQQLVEKRGNFREFSARLKRLALVAVRMFYGLKYRSKGQRAACRTGTRSCTCQKINLDGSVENWHLIPYHCRAELQFFYSSSGFAW